MTSAKVLLERDLHPVFTEFILHLQLDDVIDKHGHNTKRCSYVTLPHFTVRSIVTKTRFPYWFSGTSYLFEITRYEHAAVEDPRRRFGQKFAGGVQVAHNGFEAFEEGDRGGSGDVRWGGALYSADWDAMLGKQKELEIGCTSTWRSELNEFLDSTPAADHQDPKGKGKGKMKSDPFEELENKIEFCAGLIRSARDMAIEQVDQVAEKARIARMAERTRLTAAGSERGASGTEGEKHYKKKHTEEDDLYIGESDEEG